jgi:hypothetical protein
VKLSKRVNGQLTDLGTVQSFEVNPIGERGLPGAPVEELVAFTARLDHMNRQLAGASAAVKTLLVETGAIKDTLLRSSAAYTLREQARSIELELLEIQQKITGNEARGLYGDEGPVSISRRLEVAVMGTFRSTYGPTATHIGSIEIAELEFAGIKTSIQRISEVEMPALRKELNAAGVPWTPGRGVPGQD